MVSYLWGAGGGGVNIGDTLCSGLMQATLSKVLKTCSCETHGFTTCTCCFTNSVFGELLFDSEALISCEG